MEPNAFKASLPYTIALLIAESSLGSLGVPKSRRSFFIKWQYFLEWSK